MKDVSWTTCLRVGATAAGVYMLCAGRGALLALLAALSKALLPLLLGGGIACMVEIPMSAIERRLSRLGRRAARAVSLSVTLLGVAGAGLWLAQRILPELLRCLTLLAGELPEMLGMLHVWLQSAGAAQWLEKLTAGEELLKPLLDSAGNMLEIAMDALSALSQGAMNAALALVFAAYLLAEKETLNGQMRALALRLPVSWRLRLLPVFGALRASFRTYLTGQLAEALLLGCLCLIGMVLLRLPGALMISAMAGVTALIPLAGAPIAAAAGAVLLLPEGGSTAAAFAVFFLLLQQVESNLICPRIVGANLGLSPLWMLTAMLVGGGVCGAAGAMLAVPVAAAAKRLLREGAARSFRREGYENGSTPHSGKTDGVF